MVRPNTKKLAKMKNQDKELEKLPSIDKEKKVFRKGESILSRLMKRKKVDPAKVLKRSKINKAKAIRKTRKKR